MNKQYPKVAIEQDDLTIIYDFNNMTLLAIQDNMVIGQENFTLDQFKVSMIKVIDTLKEKGC